MLYKIREALPSLFGLRQQRKRRKWQSYKSAKRSARPRSSKGVQYSCADERAAKGGQDELSQRINLRVAE